MTSTRTSRSTTSRVTVATAAVATGLLTVGGATYAFADAGSSATPSASAPSSSSTATSSTGSASTPSQPGARPSGAPGKDHRGHHEHGKPATGTEASAVRAAIKVKFPNVSITHVDLAPNGSYHAFGASSDGKRVVYDVSKDYRTITLDTHAGDRRGGPQQRWQKATVVSGTTAIKVKAAIAKDFPGLSVTEVRQGPQGGYLAHATRGSEHVFIHVSKDLKTVDARAHDGAHR